MTTQQLTVEMLRLMSVVAEDEDTLKRAVKYLKNLVAKREDPTLMTREQFFERVDCGMQQVREGKVTRMLPDETMDDLLRRKDNIV